MNAHIPAHDIHHFMGDSATHPSEPRCGALAALLRLAGMSPQPRRALPAHPIAARSGASNCGFQGYFSVSNTFLASKWQNGGS